MRESRQIPVAAPAFEQRRERTTVKAARAGGRDRLLDGQSGELVPERGLPVSGHEHTRRDARVEPRVDLAGECLDQPRLGVRRRDRNGVEHVSCAGREAPRSRENGVPHRRGDLRPTRGENLGHEECVAGRRAVELVRVDPVRLGESSNCVRGEGRKRHSAKGDGRCELTEHESQRVTRVQLLLPIAQGDHGADRLDAAGDEADHVERRLVRPVDVLDHDDRRPAPAQLFDERRGHGVWDRVAAKEVGQSVACLGRDVVERAERLRRQERVAHPPEDAHVPGPAGAELLQERRLPGTCLAGDHRHAAVPRCRLGECRFQRGQLALALGQLGSLELLLDGQWHAPHRDPRPAPPQGPLAGTYLSSRRPRRPAAATASPREPAFSFRRIAET